MLCDFLRNFKKRVKVRFVIFVYLILHEAALTRMNANLQNFIHKLIITGKIFPFILAIICKLIVDGINFDLQRKKCLNKIYIPSLLYMVKR